MKLVSYLNDNEEQLGIFIGKYLYNLHSLHKGIPRTMEMFLETYDEFIERLLPIEAALKSGKLAAKAIVFYELLAPVPHPPSLRDAYAFRQHVLTARRNRGLGMIEEFDQFPVFYFSNHRAIQGPGDIRCMPDHLEKLDFELEVAIVIGKKGRNIKAGEADRYIAGFMIMNDLSARRLQADEMKFNLGPAKGKDFCTITGPWLVTPDELSQYQTVPRPGHKGLVYDLPMRCWVNGKLVSEGNLKDMEWTFAEIIARISYGVDIYPGDIIGSGTVGTGCFLELNGTGRLRDVNYLEQWLQVGDLVEMEVTGLGHLSNTISMSDSKASLHDNLLHINNLGNHLEIKDGL